MLKPLVFLPNFESWADFRVSSLGFYAFLWFRTLFSYVLIRFYLYKANFILFGSFILSFKLGYYCNLD